MTFDHELHVKAAACPGCGKVLDGASGPGEPEEGCATVCIYCLTVCFFTADLDLRLPDPGELETAPRGMRRQLDRVRAAILQAQREKRILDQFVFVKDVPIGDELESKLRQGQAVMVGPLCSSGPPPRRMRPAAIRLCAECHARIYVAQDSPRAPTLCPECAIKAVDKVTRGDT